MSSPVYRLYRLFDASGNLLYVGVTKMSLSTRLSGHRGEKQWWALVDIARTTVAEYSGVQEAGRAETLAIKSEHPRFNIVGVVVDKADYKDNTGVKPKPVDYSAIKRLKRLSKKGRPTIAERNPDVVAARAAGHSWLAIARAVDMTESAIRSAHRRFTD